MRKCVLNPPVNGYHRLAIQVADDGVYLLLSRKADDNGFEFDHWYETVEEAEESASEFGVHAADWQETE